MKRAFKVLAGIHIEDGKTYEKDATVVSDNDLTKLFAGKFQDMGPVKDEEPSEKEEPQSQSAPKKTKRGKKKAAKSPPLRDDDEWE